jgi:predicted Fe-Mo cluster-binding NifX family protein
MRIAVSVDNNDGLDSVVSPHFGRCPHYILVDMVGQEIRNVSAIDNPYYGRHQPGQVPAFINRHSVNVMLTGGMGRRAVAFFQQFGIEAVTGASGTVRQSLERYLDGALRGAEPCKESQKHAQHQAQPPVGVDAHDDVHGPYEEDEIGRLREEVVMLQQQLDAAMKRLGELG